MSLSERFWAKVDTSGDGCWLWTASVDNNGYGKIGAGGDRGKTLCAHRVAWEIARERPIPAGREIDHKCRVKRCVRPDHLRLVTHKQNEENKVGCGPLPRGVRRHHTGKYQARCKHNGKELNGGMYATVEEARIAAIELRNRIFTHNDADRIAV
jgi:hypothetical protein